jgi:chitodextrinase
MKRSLIVCLTALTALSLTSCFSTKEPTCNSNGYVPIVKVIGPKTATLAQPAVFVLSYSLGNDCTTLTNVEAVPSGNTTQVGLAAASNGCACNATTTVSQTSYQFQPTKAGTYYIQFLTTNNAYITDTVVVN